MRQNATNGTVSRVWLCGHGSPGAYRSDNLYIAHITLLVLNELRDEPHNALGKAFASRQREKTKLLACIETLQHILQRRLGTMPPTVHERLSRSTVNELDALINPALDGTNWEEFMAALPK